MKTIISQYQNVLISHFHEWSITGTTYGSPLVLGEKKISIFDLTAAHIIYLSPAMLFIFLTWHHQASVDDHFVYDRPLQFSYYFLSIYITS